MRIAVVGSYGAGLTMRVPRSPAAGETVSGGEFAEGPGGKGSNQAIGAARLGARVSLLTAVGDDAYGRAARALWDEEGVDATHVVTADAATMVGFILVEPDGENRIAIAPGALELLTPAHVEPFRAAIADADVLVVSMEIPADVVLAALRTARECGTRTLLNPAPAQPLADEVWPLVDVITPNQTEAPVLLGLAEDAAPSDGDLVARLRERTGGTAVLTRGGHGALVDDGCGVREVPALPVERVVDTTGAGDAFTAALAVALAGGDDTTTAVARAAAAGAHAVTVAGVIPALPTPEQLTAAPTPGTDRTHPERNDAA
ncbi:ribokinase [Streptomyces lonarensis]|uniref:Ribokinase n=1 Tax=Streptomyces lonarensis TaxID=700599 RepID=A0A7X6D0Y2_9ACTN|nr:ribokinase [Streptomyces lonarensis]NJQ06055.1 ribokinase [Streptomyces lonarensis]